MNDGRDPADIARQLADLRQQHRDLDLAVDGLKHAPVRDELALTRLKKRRLQLKDCIARLESSLIPDEPA
ncbi:YdcH family protein [Cognatilysobacter segetis]|uniref:YdcH family protein n=1 Tax=Cognatilysobacter segetis TaxID=2492394 RepID=UPI0010615547|nr:YdcH family protein [Lysobacter segetis]